MRIEESSQKSYAPRLSIYLDGFKEADRNEVAGMLRGLMCAIEGWAAISGLTNDTFSADSPVVLSFSNVKNAHRFKECVEYYFSEDILELLRVKKRIYRS